MSFKKFLGYMALFTGTMIGVMHLANRIIHYISTSDNLLEEEKNEYYDWRFGRISYKKKGTGSPLLLIHDLNVCSSSYEWNKIENDLSKQYTVYTIDLLGCGCSDRPLLTYTNYLYVQLITDFIKHIIGDKTDVIVSGESSSFVLMACSNDNTIINRIIMINPQNIVTLAKVPTKRSKMIKHILSSPIVGTFIYNIKINKKTVRKALASACYYDQNKITEKDILIAVESSQKEKTHSRYLYACLKSRYTNANVLCSLPNLNNSIFIITGTNNPENTLAAGQYQNHLPSIEIVGIDHAKQFPHIEKPEEFIEQVNILFSDSE